MRRSTTRRGRTSSPVTASAGLVTRGSTLIETLVGIAICQIATNATLVYLERADLTSKQTLERLKELQLLPPMMPLDDKIHFADLRMMGLDVLQLVRRGRSRRGECHLRRQ